MVWESTLNCFTTGSFADLECFIGNGFMSIFGTPVYLTIFAIFAGVAICWKLKIPLDLSGIFLLSLVFVINMAFAPDWILYLAIILIASIAGYGYYKLFRARG